MGYFNKSIRRIICLACLVISSAVCAEPFKPVSSLSFSVIKTAQSGGTLEAMVVDGGSWFSVRQLVHNAVLIRHPKGDFLWDSGIGREVESQMEVFNFFESQLFSIQDVRPARNQLDEQGYDSEGLMAIIPSHMHWDHASALEDFIGVPVWVQNISYDQAMKGQPPTFVLSQYDSPAMSWHMFQLDQNEYKGFARSLDIYGDESAVLVDLSGHSDGHLGLFITLASKKQYFFIGDTTWTIKGIVENKSRPAFVDWMIGVDTDFEKNALLVEKVHLLSQKDPELSIVPAHDELQLRELPVFPEFSD